PVVIVVAAVGAAGLILAGPTLRASTARGAVALAAVPVSLGVIAGLGGPLAYSLDTAATSYAGTSPTAGPPMSPGLGRPAPRGARAAGEAGRRGGGRGGRPGVGGRDRRAGWAAGLQPRHGGHLVCRHEPLRWPAHDHWPRPAGRPGCQPRPGPGPRRVRWFRGRAGGRRAGPLRGRSGRLRPRW